MGTEWIIGLLKHLFKSEAESKIKQRMIAAEGKVVEGMAGKGMEPPLASVALCSRDALFRLWKAAVPDHNGWLADQIRDATDDKVVPIVVTKVGLLATRATLVQIVQATREAAISTTLEKLG